MKTTVQDSKATDRYCQTEKNRGRIEQRVIEVYPVGDTISSNWGHAKSIVYVQRKRSDKQTASESYYLSSLTVSARKMAAGIRSHWKIENTLHYVKDVVTHEDDSKIKQTNGTSALACFRTIAINAFRINGQKSIKNAIRRNSGNLVKLLKFIE
jgi:predicted transposase YbfD/YdcC